MVGTSKWVEISGKSVSDIVAFKDIIYALDNKSGDILRYDGTPMSWTPVGGPGFQFVANENALYGISPNKGAVEQFTETPYQWQPIGGALDALIAGGDSLYGIEPGSRNILRYDGTPLNWTRIGGPGFQFVANDKRLCGLTPDTQNVMLYLDTPDQWEAIGGAMETLIIANNALYGIEPGSRNILRYDGTPMSWTRIGGPGFQFAAHGIRLVGITPDQQGIAQYSGIPDQWTNIGDTTNFGSLIQKIVVGDDFLFALCEDRVFAYEFTHVSEEREGNVLGPQELQVGRSMWIWSFLTADKLFAGYDGEVTLGIVEPGDNSAETFTLPITHFERGRIYACPYLAGSALLGSISLQGEENFWDDQWNVESATGWCIPAQTRYTFEINQKIPNSGTANFFPTSITSAHTQLYVSTVYVWALRQTDLGKNWGHVSMKLSDGTYISWYPIEVNRKSIPFLSSLFTAPARDPQTFEEDVQLEDGRQPDTVVSVFGLKEDKIKQWWLNFKQGHQWSSLTQNCSTTIAQAFIEGGALAILNGREDEVIEAVTIWAPWDILTFASFIQGHAPS